jgi:opacity protein-like surface antigen
LPGDDKVSFAWALMAGFGYQLTDRAILDVGYRYIDMGSAQSSNVGGTRLEVDDMRAHEIKIGLRYHLGSSPVPLK